MRSPRRRRPLVAACLPYVLLSVLAGFVHLHPLQVGVTPLASASEPATAPGHHQTAPASPACAVCMWMQAGTGVQPSISSGPILVELASAPPTFEAFTPLRPALLSPALRGPPSLRIS